MAFRLGLKIATENYYRKHGWLISSVVRPLWSSHSEMVICVVTYVSKSYHSTVFKYR